MKFLFILLFNLVAIAGYCQNIWMTPNVGQWADSIDYTVPVNKGRIYLGEAGFNFFMYELPDHHTKSQESIPIHSILQRFHGANWMKKSAGSQKSTHYSSFFQGNDSTKWRSQEIGRAHV